MLFEWFNTREAVETGATLADRFPLRAGTSSAARRNNPAPHRETVQKFFESAAGEIRGRRLNFYKRAKLANAFKWKLLENGVDPAMADEATRTLVLHISTLHGSAPAVAPGGQDVSGAGSARNLSALADAALAAGDYLNAAGHLEELVRIKPRDARALNNLAAAFQRLGRYGEAERCLREAIARNPNLYEAHENLGTLHLARGTFAQAEASFRRALKLKPGSLSARSQLGLTLVSQGRLDDAGKQLERVLKVNPRHAEALYGMGLIARSQGRFEEARNLFERSVASDPTMARACSALVGLGKMTGADASWLKRAEELIARGIAPLDEATVRFAIGKYCDDTRDFARAFMNYKLANGLLKASAPPYDRDARTQLVSDLIRTHTAEALRSVEAASASARPLFVVGMMRSGTSLLEQIIASHPAICGAGELAFWHDTVRRHDAEVRRGVLGTGVRTRLAQEYLRILDAHSARARYVVDKMPNNSDYLGIIHSVFPKARVIYMRRDPIDTCLSCYFQQFTGSVGFAMDLSDLAHYYKEHQRLVTHWRSALPPGAILDVDYEGLITDQEGWTRRILQFLELEWDGRCMEFHATERPVITASYWQVRQRVYTDSLQRWHNYKKHIGPLLDLGVSA